MPAASTNVKKSFRISQELGRRAEEVAARTLQTESDIYRVAVEKYLSPSLNEPVHAGSEQLNSAMQSIVTGQADLSRFMGDLTSAMRALSIRIDNLEKRYGSDALTTVEMIARQAEATRDVQAQTSTAVVDVVEKLNARFSTLIEIVKGKSK